MSASTIQSSGARQVHLPAPQFYQPWGLEGEFQLLDSHHGQSLLWRLWSGSVSTSPAGWLPKRPNKLPVEIPLPFNRAHGLTALSSNSDSGQPSHKCLHSYRFKVQTQRDERWDRQGQDKVGTQGWAGLELRLFNVSWGVWFILPSVRADEMTAHHIQTVFNAH